MTLGLDVEFLRAARARRSALIGFSVYNLEQGLAVVQAAEAEGVPVLLQAGSSAFRYARRDPLVNLALGLAESSNADVGVHLDHATRLDEIDACLRAGYTSVMIDGSGLPFKQNISLTREVVKMAHAAGSWVEAELAGIAGNEDQSSNVRATQMTDPQRAAEFVAATDVDALAVAVGNVHGIPAEPITLDLNRLEAIGDAVAIPLVLHGASGLPEPDLHAAISLGVAKLNVNTELRRAFRDGVLAAGAESPRGDGIAPLMADTIQRMQLVAQSKLRAFTGT